MSIAETTTRRTLEARRGICDDSKDYSIPYSYGTEGYVVPAGFHTDL